MSPSVHLKNIVQISCFAKKLQEAIERAPPVDTEDNASALSLGASEDDLHLWIMRNIQNLGSGLSVSEHESSVSVGNIDIPAESDDGIVVIEVQKGMAGADAVGQVLGYVGDVHRETDENVRGMLIAEDFTARAKRAAERSELDLFQVKFNPKLNPVT